MTKKVLGLILELNPFHNGHKYFIDKVKEEINPDLTVAIISASFTMRGDISVIDKFTKAKLCIENGIDVVLELPFVYANNSANFFANACISILNDFKITHLAFGSELGDINKLNKIYAITKTENYNNDFKSYIEKGNSYPNSSLKAFMNNCEDKELINVFSLPNNTLALAYLDAIKNTNSKIIPYTIKRVDNDYYSKDAISGHFASATALRELINKDKYIQDFIPQYKYDFINTDIANEKIYQLFRYNLITKDIKNIAGINEGIENRLINFITSKDYQTFVTNVQTKRYPVNRIMRIILNVIFNITKEYENIREYEPYLRVLACNNNGLKSLKNKNIINNTKKALDSSNEEIKKILIKELEITKIYDLITEKNIFKEEFKFIVIKNSQEINN